MRYNKYGQPRIRLYGLLKIPLLLLLICLTVQAKLSTKALSKRELADEVKVNFVSGAYTITFSIDDEEKDKFTIENISCRIGSGQAIVANEQHVCEKLDPCSDYTNVVTLKSTDPESSTSFDQVVYARTEYIEPQTNLTSLIATETSIELKWETTDRACVKDFEIWASAPEKTQTRQQYNHESNCTFVDMYPCRTYNVTLLTRIDANVVVDTDTQLVDTLYLEPGDLTLTISNRTNGDTRITWTDPENWTCIGNITIVWRRNGCESEEETATTEIETTTTEDDVTGGTNAPENGTPPPRVKCVWSDFTKDPTLKQYTITDLQGCANHTIEMFINIDLNSTAKASEKFVSAEKLPSAITNLISIPNATELNWLWSPPNDHPQCVSEYKVTLTGPTQHPEQENYPKETNETFVLFTHLEPCGIYNVEIVPISLNGSSGATFKSDSTQKEDNPSEILEPESNLSAFSIELSWKTPEYANLCIDGYRVVGWMDDEMAWSVETQNNSVLFDKNLIACQAYTLQIIPYTREKLDGALGKIEVETKAAVVNFEKINLQVAGNGATSHSLELNANNQDYDNNCQTIFAQFNCSTNVDVANKYAEKYVESHREGRGFQARLAPLSPFTSYTCSVLLYNVAGASKLRSITGPKTERYFPDQPENVTLEASDKYRLTFSWSQPKYVNGQMKYYQAFLMRYEADYYVPSVCDPIFESSKTDTKGDVTNTFNDLSPAVKYIMQVAAQNDFGLGQYTAPMIGITQPDVSGPVTNLIVSNLGLSVDRKANLSYKANVTIEWVMPCKSNGEIECFVLDFSAKRENGPVENSFQRKVQPDTRDPKGRMSYTETDLMPEYNYTVNVAVRTRNVDALSENVKAEFQSPSGLPAALADDVVRQMRVSAYETNHPTSSAIVRLPANIMNSEAGNITYIALLLSQKSCAGEPELGYDVLESWPDVRSWAEIGGDCIYQYQTTPEQWQPMINLGNKRDGSEDEIIYTIGIEKCPDKTKSYCNGPLTANTEYNMVVRLFTRSGYNDAALLEFKTDAAIKVTLILVSVCSCLLLAFVLGLVVLWVRKRIAWHRDSGQGIEDPFGNVIDKNFAIFYAEVAKPEKLAREFKEITIVALELSYAASELGSNKNRYADIYPYDKNRVILDIDTEGSDYINASFIDGHTRKKEYIATQGPKPESVMDFWRMILQHNVRVIVQVTQFREGNTIKCHEYYPYNMRNISVTVKSKECFEIYDRTELCVVHEKYDLKEKVIHFYFKKWPDHGCPDDPMHLITFVKKVKAEKRPNYSPIVVHCSAGVGRTGTFIGLDLIMQRLKSESKINIFETVKKLRFQRMKMVQTQQQYTFLYACTYELVKHKIPRAALKLDVRPNSVSTTPMSNTKKVSFPEIDLASMGVKHVPDPELGDVGDVTTTGAQLPLRLNGIRRTKDSIYEQSENGGSRRPNAGNDECAI